MATIDPARALPVYRQNYGTLHDELLMRNIVIADLEEQLAEVQAENATLRAQLAASQAEPTT